MLMNTFIDSKLCSVGYACHGWYPHPGSVQSVPCVLAGTPTLADGAAQVGECFYTGGFRLSNLHRGCGWDANSHHLCV